MTIPVIDSFSGKHRFLSNFWLTSIEYEGIDYPSSEHAFQSAKTLDKNTRRRISKLKNPREAKSAGRLLEIREDWEEVRLKVMEDILRIKFSDESLKEWLIETGNAELIEGNYWGDVFWGVCRGIGENHLGQILMKIRSELS